MSDEAVPLAEKIPLEVVIGSTALSGLGYNPQKQILAVELKESGRIMHHAGVPVEVAAGFNVAESKGKYYINEIVRKGYRAERMTGLCPQCIDGEGWIGEKCSDCGTANYVLPPPGQGRRRLVADKAAREAK